MPKGNAGTIGALDQAEARHQAATAAWLGAAARARREGTASSVRDAERALRTAGRAEADEAAAWWAWRGRGSPAELAAKEER